MQRYFVEEAAIDDRFYIFGEDLRHIVKVMRMKEGGQIICVDPHGKCALCIIEEITDEQAAAEVVQWIEGSSELPVDITIVSGLPKGDKLEWIIQKGTELGACRFIPFTSARSVVKWDAKKAEKKVDRWQKIAKEAAEQSHRTKVPEVLAPQDLKSLLKLCLGYTHKLIAFEEEARQGEASVLSKTLTSMKKGDSLIILFGPEGGLTNQEVSILQEQGFLACGLGPRILRTETAPMYLLSAVSYQLELMR
ncbi:16S rRNA (uracil(1498)-N(3))-methyltransferase [Cytobacillus sp. NCCP-133]|uniref:16S rRNA (uracil(1498)-N(3))-methyltransferase n=1 Tax=Cytobacillus sp. NCCP-133 TaxID=766848 RepID=UPI00223071CC|nr:16S rRNA (uracil(1498)-N(3))-methyltransferase [Cytobacillus sp. NCCP-133]GLB58259.1 ribosomal RNA small subunit methyltransferase E [Cytobacillus sp. NCCP-133]